MNRRTKTWRWVSGVVLGSLLLSGCTAAAPSTPETPPVQGEQPVPPQAPPVQKQTAPVRITLDEEPRLQSPLRTLVANLQQDYTLTFLEPMNRQSVEQAIQKQVDAKTDGTGAKIPLDLTFRWENDQKLHLHVVVSSIKQENTYTLGSYQITVAGAQTQSGKTLEKPDTFRAVLTEPNQLWRMSLDGKVREPLTTFNRPYNLTFLDENDRYLLLSRYTNYCQCDAPSPKLYAVYDTESKKQTDYPVELLTRYVGEGTFVADQRGFFYQAPEAGIQVPTSDTAYSVTVPGYVHGASFSKDRDYVLIALGKNKEQKGDYDLLIHHLKTKEQRLLPQALKGGEPPDMLSGTSKIPVHFQDDGRFVYFATYEQTEHTYIPHYYRYSWDTKTVLPWAPPAKGYGFAEFKDSSDGLYRLYPDPSHSLYKGETQVSYDQNLFSGHWINGTHLIARLNGEEQGAEMYRQSLQLFDADKNAAKTIAKGLPSNAELIGASPDGKWVYLSSNFSLTK